MVPFQLIFQEIRMSTLHDRQTETKYKQCNEIKNIALLFEDKCLKTVPHQYTKAYVADDMKLQKCRPKIIQNTLNEG